MALVGSLASCRPAPTPPEATPEPPGAHPVSTDIGPTEVQQRKAPYLRVSLHPGDISGAAAPLAPVTLELRTAGGVLRGQGLARADAEGDFMAWIHDAAGERVRPAPGDRVTVEAGDGLRSMEVDVLTGTADASAGILAGTGQPGAAIDLTLWNPWRPGEYATPKTEVDASGRWSADPGVPIEPATHYYITEHLPTGDQVFHCQQIPRLHIEPGSPRVRIEALSDLTGTLSLARDGRIVAQAEGTERWSGELALDLADAAGRLVALDPGDRLSGSINGKSIDLAVPVFEADLDAEAGVIRGRTVPGWTVALAAPAPITSSAQVAGADGSFSLSLDTAGLDPDGPGPGQVWDVYTVTPDKHNVGRRLEGQEISMDLDANRITGRMGSESQPPDRLLQDPPDLTLTYNPQTGLASGRGPADEALELLVYLGRASPGDSLSAIADPDGQWSLNLRGEPERGFRYDPAAVRRLELRWAAEPGVVYRRAWEGR